jgi:mannosyltransferase
VVAGSVYLMRMSAVVKFDLLHTAVPILGAMVALAGCVGLFRMRHRLEGRVLLLGVIVLPVLILAISLFKSMLLPRYILWSAVPFFVLVGLGAAALPRRALPVAVAALVLMGAVNLGPVYRVETKPRWDMAAATLAANVRPGDTVFTADPNAPTMLTVLQPKSGTPIEANALVTSQLDQAVARWKQGGRIWAVNGRSALGQREELAAFKSRMAALGTPAVEIPQGKEITILMFPAPDEPAPN